MEELVQYLQKAHAGEIAAYLAYEGHWRSVRDPHDREAIQRIQIDELTHIWTLKEMLDRLGAKPSSLRDLVMSWVGKTVSAMCYVTGYIMPMRGAAMMETVGTLSYREMAMLAEEHDMPEMAKQLTEMGNMEEAHEKFFSARAKR